MDKKKVKSRIHAINAIQNRVGQMRFWGTGIFLTVTVSLVFASVMLMNFVNYTGTNILSIEKQPLATPMLAFAVLVSLYLSLEISLIVSREYSNSTVEILLYGPVDEIAYITGNFLAQIRIFSMSLVFSLIWLNVASWLLNLDFRLDLILVLIPAILMCAELVGFGILTATWGGKQRSTLTYYLLGILLIGGIQIADSVVSTVVQVQSEIVTDSLILIRDILASANNLLAWISPYAQYNQAVEALMNNAFPGFLFNLALMLVETLILVYGAIAILKKKGVRG